MKTARVSLCLAIVLSWALASPVAAQQSLPPGQNTFGGWPDESMPGTDDIHTRSIFDQRNIMLRTDGGDGTGYLRGYQTIAAFQPIQLVPDEFILWMSPRGYVTFNSGNFAGNLGTGFRWLNQETQRIFGGGAWWDHDNNGLNNYDQLGGSLEWLGKYFDLRANAYVPTNQNVHQIAKFFNNNNVFILNNIGVGQTTITNSALRGGDFEAGGALPGIGDLGLRTYVGGYYYQGPASEGGLYGVRARIEALVTQDMWGTVAVSHDRVFGTNVTCAATFYLFTGNETQWFRRIPMETRLYQQMERQYRVAVQKSVANDTILALRAGGTGGSGGPVGTPINVLHVDNTAPAGGDGTVEHPLNFLPTTTGSNVDIVFVHRGTGTSFNMNQGTTLNNFERLLGQGVPHQFTDTQGTFNLPGFSPGPLPSITNVNPGGSAVTLASHNEVSGFNIANSALHGITGSNIVDFNINNVNITASGNSLGPVPVGAGVQLTNATGTGLVTQSTLIGNNAEGFRVDNSAGGTLKLTVANVQANSNLTGIMLNATGSTINPTVTQTTANTNVRDGISITLANSGATRSAMTGAFDHVTASGNNPSGIGPTLPSGQLLFGNGFTYTSTTSDAVISITHSTFDINRLNGVSFTTSADSSLSASLVNNNTTINGNVQNGVLFTNTDSQVFATLLNNTINNNGGFGIGVVSKGTGAFGTNFVLNVGGYLTQDTNGDGSLSTGEDGTAI
ncbi:MAG: inverse autotransporter beta domain-containing protein, partial [Planctomycetia bacterium]|nr:inverse autotransporter beta domain-containing protein [Planctomycetia bacterium]